MAVSEMVIDKGKAVREVKEWIQFILRRKNWNSTELAKKAGISPSTILRMFSDKNYTFVSTLSTIAKIAAASGMNPPPSLLESFGVNQSGFETGLSAMKFEAKVGGISGVKHVPIDTWRSISSGEQIERVTGGEEVPHKTSGVTDVLPPDRGRSESGGRRRAGHMIPKRFASSLPLALHPKGESEAMIECPPRLVGDKTAFAFSISDPAMGPWVPSGSLMYATQARNPIPGDILLLTKNDGRSLVRIMVSTDEEGVVVGKADGSDPSTIPFADISEIGIVVMMERC